MKKSVLVLAATSVFAFANDTTVSATMSLMNQGIQNVQTGLMYNDPQSIKAGIQTLENSNAIFKTVDVSTFIQNNHKVGTTKNINSNLDTNIAALKKAVHEKSFSKISESYGKILNNCMACHQIVRGW
jgi:protein associated with RNAse G/E